MAPKETTKKTSEANKNAAVRYMKNQQFRIPVGYIKEDYDTFVAPVIEQLGYPVAAFYKKCAFDAIKDEVLAHPRKYDKEIVQYYKTHQFALVRQKNALYGKVVEIDKDN